jgi:hypothetical protein
MEINNKVILNTFLGTKASIEKVDARENYWKLVGQTGTILERKNNRVLVKFDSKIDQFKLENHNLVKDSLWILSSDLVIKK